MPLLLDGKKCRDQRAEVLIKEFASLSYRPRLAIIQVGDREDSNSYISQKKKFGEKLGVEVIHIKLKELIEENKIIDEIKGLNKDRSVQGIIVQIPLPANLNKNRIIDLISSDKDVDGLTSENIKKLFDGSPKFIPATAKGILSLLDFYQIPIEGKRVTVVGRSSLVGKPVVLAMLARGATVTVCHSKTLNLKEETKKAEILILATGKPKLITKDYLSKGQVVVDVGINIIGGNKLDEEVYGKKIVGDVDFESVKNMVAAISPVPGGVGPMTVLSLFENLLLSCRS